MTQKKLSIVNNDLYPKFKSINGKHAMQSLPDDFHVNYQARLRKGGSVFYFNFSLAKEMGLIDKLHPDKLNKKLEKAILETFGLIIINEYDIENKKKFPIEDIKQNKYMATRYLQLQHPDGLGKNSGDGRSIWNGQTKYKNKVWDIASRGTGATKLSPATSIHNRFFESGDPSVSYGCGYAEIDEALGTVFFSEVLNANGIKTERVLAVIDYGDGICINVRAYPNLLRPSHFFMHLKQNNLDALKTLFNYFAQRQIDNGHFSQELFQKNPHRYALEKFVNNFAKVAAKFEDEYIFCWMDWDGDNILMDGGIIDYGSIRQFGLFHHEYRYDDVERYSTSIKEQKEKVKYMVQVYAQMIDYIETGIKSPVQNFKDHWSMSLFEKVFNECKNYNLLEKIGFEEKQINLILEKNSKDVEHFRTVFSYFERAKSLEGLHEVPDGINWNAIFCMRDLLRVLPQLYIAKYEPIEYHEFIEIMASTYATEDDLELTPYRCSKIDEFQKYYFKFLKQVSKLQGVEESSILMHINLNASVRNRHDRITGDSITFIVDKVLKNLSNFEGKIFDVVADFTRYQSLDALTKQNKKIKYKHEKILRKFFDIVIECREGI